MPRLSISLDETFYRALARLAEHTQQPIAKLVADLLQPAHSPVSRMADHFDMIRALDDNSRKAVVNGLNESISSMERFLDAHVISVAEDTASEFRTTRKQKVSEIVGLEIESKIHRNNSRTK